MKKIVRMKILTHILIFLFPAFVQATTVSAGTLMGGFSVSGSGAAFDWCIYGRVSWSDFDGDGLEDIHCDDGGNHYVLISDGMGSFIPPANSTASDGYLEINNQTLWCTTGQVSWSDFDGDGLEDIHCDEGGKHYVKISDGTGSFISPANSTASNGYLEINDQHLWCSTGQVSWSDFDCDGLEDIHCDQDGKHYVKISDGMGSFIPPANITDPHGYLEINNQNLWCTTGQVSWSDFDGDGLEDIHCSENGKHYVKISDGMGSFISPANSTASNGYLEINNQILWCTTGQVSWSDFNGDGLEDIHCDNGGNHYVKISDGMGSFVSPTNITASDGYLEINNQNLWCTTGQVSWSDFNGDGLKDIHCSENGKHYVKISNGMGNFIPPANSTASNGYLEINDQHLWCSAGQVSWSDFDGDSLEDIHCSENGKHYVKISDGMGSFIPPANIDASNGRLGTIRQHIPPCYACGLTSL